MTAYMRKKGITKELQIKIKKYLEYALTEESLIKANDDTIKSILSGSLRNELINQVYGTMLGTNSLLSKIFELSFLSKVTSIIQERFYSPEDVVCLVSSNNFL